MITWGSLLADIRADIKDTGERPRWPDDTLFLFAKDAIRTYSLDLPKLVYREELAATNGVFALPANFLAVVTVELAEREYLEPFGVRPGISRRKPHRATQYYVAGGSLHLDVPPAGEDTILLTYKALYEVPISKDDLACQITLPADDEETIRVYVKAKVSEQVRLSQSNLDRFKPGTGQRDDNPMLPEYETLMREFQLRIAQKLGGSITTYRTGRL